MVTTTTEPLVLTDYERKLTDLVGGMDARHAEDLYDDRHHQTEDDFTSLPILPYLVPLSVERDGERRIYKNVASGGILYTFIVSPNRPIEVKHWRLDPYTLNELDELGLIHPE
ncbi:MAG: hypothetical protein HYS62_01090 [Candidatus Aenigmarchaeota archaeon]|nr:hypothetical protein [Candidatus Aenigmarchaeota archaeon]